jgi:hypothetical protein
VDEHYIAISILGVLQSLASSHRDDADFDTGLLGEKRQYMLEQA